MPTPAMLTASVAGRVRRARTRVQRPSGEDRRTSTIAATNSACTTARTTTNPRIAKKPFRRPNKPVDSVASKLVPTGGRASAFVNRANGPSNPSASAAEPLEDHRDGDARRRSPGCPR